MDSPSLSARLSAREDYVQPMEEEGGLPAAESTFQFNKAAVKQRMARQTAAAAASPPILSSGAAAAGAR